MKKILLVILLCGVMGITGCKSLENEEYSFYGKILETHQSYIVVKPNEGEDERAISNRFIVELLDNDITYEVGTYVKITYTGLINESYPAQIEAIKIELESNRDFELIFHQEPGNVKRQIMDKHNNKKYDYNVYVWNGTVEIVLDNKTYSLEKALKKNLIMVDEIVAQAMKDFPNALSYDDGGSTEYHYEDYTIIKLNKLSGSRDVYIGNKDLKMYDIDK